MSLFRLRLEGSGYCNARRRGRGVRRVFALEGRLGMERSSPVSPPAVEHWTVLARDALVDRRNWATPPAWVGTAWSFPAGARAMTNVTTFGPGRNVFGLTLGVHRLRDQTGTLIARAARSRSLMFVGTDLINLPISFSHDAGLRRPGPARSSSGVLSGGAGRLTKQGRRRS